MGSDQHAGQVADEQARNRRYLEWLRRKADQTIEVGVPSSANWTRTGLPSLNRPQVFAVIGRVGLQSFDDDVGADSFYIGPRHCQEGDVPVFSWAAPVAAAFFGMADTGPFRGQVQV
jgi:DNA helicase IV